MAQIKTITATTTEQAITFDEQYQFVWLKNMGDTDCYVSGHSGITANADGVAILKAGENVRLTPADDTVYIKAVSGTPTIEAHAQSYAECPFKKQAKGGESEITVVPLLARYNNTYTAPEGKAYSPVTVEVAQTRVEELTIIRNNYTEQGGAGLAFNPVHIAVPMSTLRAGANGTYTAESAGVEGWDTAIIDVYEKYNILFYAGRNDIGGFSLTDSITAGKYDEIYFIGSYQYSDTSVPTNNICDLWSTRYTVDTVLKRGYIGNCGDGNYKWIRGSQHGTELQDFSPASGSYDASFMMIGVKTKNADRDTLWSNSETTSPASITLSDSLFDYDEIILTFSTGSYDENSHTVTCSYPTSELATGKIIYAYDSGDGHIMKWEVTSGTVLTKVSENYYHLVDVQGIKDTSREETVLYTNSGTTNPTEITLSSSYENFDEIYLVGHVASDADIISTSIFPVKAISQPIDIPKNKMIGMFTDTLNFWYVFIDGTTLRNMVQPAGIILDKIIGIKRHVSALQG